MTSRVCRLDPKIGKIQYPVRYQDGCFILSSYAEHGDDYKKPENYARVQSEQGMIDLIRLGYSVRIKVEGGYSLVCDNLYIDGQPLALEEASEEETKLSCFIDTSFLKHAIAHTEHFLKCIEYVTADCSPNLVFQLQYGTVKAFEHAYEVALKVLRKCLRATEQSASDIDHMDFNSLIQLGVKQGLLSAEPVAWERFRGSCDTDHPFHSQDGMQKALDTVREFVAEAKFLCFEIIKRFPDDPKRHALLYDDGSILDTIKMILRACLPGSTKTWCQKTKNGNEIVSWDFAVDPQRPFTTEEMGVLNDTLVKAGLDHIVNIIDMRTISSEFRKIIQESWTGFHLPRLHRSLEFVANQGW